MADTNIIKVLTEEGIGAFWTKIKEHVASAVSGKVDKVAGKGLSTNDFTTAEKEKLKNIAEGANSYTLPDATATVKGGVIVGENLTVSGGKVSVANASATAKGVVQLSSATNDTSTDKAATASAVKAAYDLAAGKQAPATTLKGYGITDAYTKTEIDTKMTSAMHYRGTKATYGDLPTTGNELGDVWNITAADKAHGINAGDNVAWNGTGWDVQAGTIDLSAYMLTENIAAITSEELDTICK